MRASRNWDDRGVMRPSEVEARYGVEIRPCPFCRCPTVGLYMGPSPHMTCANCGADGPTFEGRGGTLEQRQHEAVTAWNGAMPRQPMLDPKKMTI